MTDLAPRDSSAAQRSEALAPTISAVRGNVISGAHFLPDHIVTVRVSYVADGISDYLTYRTNPRGDLYAEVPTSAGPGALHVSATDHRADPHGACALLWSNTEILRT